MPAHHNGMVRYLSRLITDKELKMNLTDVLNTLNSSLFTTPAEHRKAVDRLERYYRNNCREYTLDDLKAAIECINTAHEVVGDKKYELIHDDTKHVSPTQVVYRIRALKSFGGIKAGMVGGYVESEVNLSHFGNCWIDDDAVVSDNARVMDNAIVSDTAHVSDSAVIKDQAEVSGTVCDNAVIAGEAVVDEKATVYGNAVITDSVYIGGTARVSNHATVSGAAHISDNAYIDGNAVITGEAKVSDNVQVGGTAIVKGTAYITGEALLHDGAMVTKHTDYAVLGRGNDYITAYKTSYGGACAYYQDKRHIPETLTIENNPMVAVFSLLQ